MKKITKDIVLNNLEECKKYVQEIEQEGIKEEKVVGIAIKNRFTGEIIFQSTKTTYKEAIKEKGDADLCDADLRGADLCDADLRGADLRDANLRDANLRGADLRDANLRGADLCDADLRGADLCDADLCGADLCDANLCDADLRDANLCDAELMNAKFYGKGGTKVILKKDLDNFLQALGFVVE